MLIRPRKSVRSHAAKVMAVLALAGSALVILPATSALADTRGSAPNLVLDCGAQRDIPNQWHVVANAGYCSGWGYSWIFTSPSYNHFAIWQLPENVINEGTSTAHLPVEAWIPSKDAGQHTAYYYQLCGTSSWTYIGQLFQNDDTGWYTPGNVALPPLAALCSIKEQNTGGTSFDMAEDALGVSS